MPSFLVVFFHVRYNESPEIMEIARNNTTQTGERSCAEMERYLPALNGGIRTYVCTFQSNNESSLKYIFTYKHASQQHTFLAGLTVLLLLSLQFTSMTFQTNLPWERIQHVGTLPVSMQPSSIFPHWHLKIKTYINFLLTRKKFNMIMISFSWKLIFDFTCWKSSNYMLSKPGGDGGADLGLEYWFSCTVGITQGILPSASTANLGSKHGNDPVFRICVTCS